jgi:hypothetical protein
MIKRGNYRFPALPPEDSELFRAALDEQLVPELLIAQLTQPLLVFLHGADDLTTPDTVQMMYDAAFTQKELVVFPDLEHVRGLYFRTDEYMEHLERFLVRVWESDVAGAKQDGARQTGAASAPCR